jgi:exodeoxyribonuclease V beta subunit
VADIFNFTSVPLEGQSVIEASAGTGKTYAIMQIYLRLLLEKKMPSESILVVTFTDAATAELRSRIRGSLVRCARELKGEIGAFSNENPYFIRYLDPAGDRARETGEVINAALSSFDECAIFTIHGFCKRVLRDHAFEYSTIFNAELVDDMEEFEREVTFDYYRKEMYRAGRFALDWAEYSKISVESLLKLLHAAMSRLQCTIIPKSGDFRIDRIETRISDLFIEFRDAWNLHVNGFFNVLADDASSLNKRSYDPDKFSGWRAIMSDFTARAYAFTFPECIKYFMSETIRSAVKKDMSAERVIAHPLVAAADGFAEQFRALSRDIALAAAQFRTDYLHYAFRELTGRKRAKNLWSFDDLIRQVYDGLSGESGNAIAASLRRKYHAALIDEFQDTDPIQCSIFDTIFAHPSTALFYIGDPKQAIYSFRGADVYAYISAKKGRTIYYKDENWRSNAPLIEGINTIFSRINPFMLGDDVKYHPVRTAAGQSLISKKIVCEPFIIRMIGGTDDKAVSEAAARSMIEASVAGEIAALLGASKRGDAIIQATGGSSRQLRPGDIAVIVRRNSDAARMKERLRIAGISSVIAQSGSVFASDIRWHFDCVLGAIALRTDAVIRAALATDCIGYDAARIDSLLCDESAWEGILQIFRNCDNAWRNRGFMAMTSILFGEFDMRETLVTRCDGVRKLADLMHIVELYHHESAAEGFGPAELLSWSERRLKESPRAEEYQVRLESDDDAVKIITVHRSKGLEFPVVFACCGWERFDNARKPRYFYHNESGIVCDLIHAQDKESEEYRRAGEELAAEQMRLFYVALTRASCRLYAFAGKISGYELSSAAYLFHHDRGVDVDSLRIAVKGMPYGEIIGDISRFAKKGVLRVEDITVTEPQFLRERNDAIDTLAPRSFSRIIRDDWKISSFSYIVSKMHDNREREFEGIDRATDSVDDGMPRGPVMGNCIHRIFESIDFEKFEVYETEKIIHDALVAYGLHSDPVQSYVRAMVEAVITRSIGILGAPMSAIGRGSYKREMEFYLPAKSIGDKALRNAIFENINSKTFNGGITENLSSLSFDAFAGFLRGFIDLVFEYNGKFYIADWKTNYLGPTADNYSYDRLCGAMDEHLYTVQSLIYTLALDRHLAARMTDYDYERHFGGVFYIFVRGPVFGEGTGIWEDRPPLKLVRALSKLVIRGGDNA